MLGARGNFVIEELKGKLQEIGVLGLDPQMVCGKDHLLAAADCAQRAFATQHHICSTLAMETMLYASGERQIAKAAEKMSIKSPQEVALVIFDRDPQEVLTQLSLTLDDTLLEPSEEKMLRFGISQAELASVTASKKYDLVLEHVAFASLRNK